MMAGTLMAAVSPAIASAQSPQDSDAKPVPILKASASAGIQDFARAESPRSSEPAPQKVAVTTARLVNLKSGKALQAVSTANGARVVQQPTTSGQGLQIWEVYLFGDYYTFENQAAGRNLGINGASTSAGAAAITATPSGDLNQDWFADWNGYGGEYFAMVSRKSGLCLGITGASTANGAAAAQFPCDDSANQGWAMH
ncbi:alpha-glucosidase [Streptomyces hawaiiensis]|uniref:Alpha-glucosidase n=2 Tax=Streptomyces hawaiiensis TaxID=67305 RepID=A0A6G5RR57_9ACTN|nr:alpha-glucosidase [Streptomyces hawaiiensis]